MREKQATGIINERGRLSMYMDELNEYFANHKGERVIARFVLVPRGTSEALTAYYYNYIVPAFRAAIWQAGERLDEETTEERLREWSPIMREQEADHITGKYRTRIRAIHELSNWELCEHIDHLKQLAAEEYGVYIEDPRTV